MAKARTAEETALIESSTREPAVALDHCLAVPGDEPETLLIRASEAADSASHELLTAIARAAVIVYAAGIPHVEPTQRDAVMGLHSLLFGS